MSFHQQGEELEGLATLEHEMIIEIDDDTVTLIKDFSGSAGFTGLLLLFGYAPLTSFLVVFFLGMYLIFRGKNDIEEMMMAEVMAWLFGMGFTLVIYTELISRLGDQVPIF